MQIESHADGDEEESQQHVAIRLDVFLDLEAVFGLRDEHAGEKGAEHERQARQTGQEREQQDNQQHVQHEELGRAQPRHNAEPRAHQPRAREHHQR